MFVRSSTVLNAIVSIIVIIKINFSHVAFPVKQVQTFEEQLRVIEEVEKTPSEKRTDVAQRLGLPPSTLNSIIAKKREIREQDDKCGSSAKRRKTGMESIYSKLENGLSNQVCPWMGSSCRKNLSK
jgi:hypothetical protein